MLTIEEVRKGLQDRKLRVVSEQVGLAYDTVWRVKSGKAKRISYEVIKVLSDYLEGNSETGKENG